MSEINVKTKVKQGASPQEIFEAILYSRGYKTHAAQRNFFTPPEPTIELLLKETGIKQTALKKAQTLLDSHLSQNHDLCIFGDYDADGVSATAVMWQGISAYAKKAKSHSRILPFLPDRHKHGYGLGSKAVREVITGSAFGDTKHKRFLPKLIITVDTGIVGHEGVASFKEAGIDVIITDHHQPDSSLPPADGLIHTTATSGAGVAWIFVLYLLGESAMTLLDLTVIGVVGDMMPLAGLNRSICVTGLRSLTQSRRPGILALKQAMGIRTKNLTTYDISFGIAPRINASGRIYNPLDALRLLCTSDANLATELATKIESHNHDRQEYTDRALKLAVTQQTTHKIIVIVGDYHEGVIGLVAGKLTELFHRPAVVMGQNGEVIKGSARSIPGVNITSLLRALKTPFLGLGGHEQAAGFSLAHHNLAAMQAELEILADQTISDELLVKRYSADLELDLSSISLELAQRLTKLEPFGIGNPKPKFLFKDIQILEDRQLGQTGKHRKLFLTSSRQPLELLLFNTQLDYPLTQLKQVIASLEINSWNGQESVQLIASHVEI